MRSAAARKRRIFRPLIAGFAALCLCACSGPALDGQAPRAAANDATSRAAIDAIGTPVSAADIAAWNIDVAPDGRGLPAGSGDVASGAQIFAAKCAACHGAKGEGV
jgi:cytochrome c1